MSQNPLLDDRLVEFVLYEVLKAQNLCRLDYFADHSRENFELYLGSVRRLARERLYPAYRPMDEEPPELVDGRIKLHPLMRELFPQLCELGMIAATRPLDVGGQQLPQTVGVLANLYVMAANLSAGGFVGLTAGAGHLVEAFGDEELKRRFMEPMYEGEWTGTMALTEPQAGSSLGDLTTSATATDQGHYLIRGSKIFISGGDHDLTDNVVHMTLARIDGAPGGTKGISLFAVPRLREGEGGLVDNDVRTTQAIHKIGWKGLPSLALNYGEAGECHGWLVGEPNRGLAYMFQMMNEARLMVGANGVATASVAYHESVAYAKERTQGRPATMRDPSKPPIPIVEHADVRRMLLRQKAIVEGGLSLIARSARYADLAEHAETEEERTRAAAILDTLTPVAKTFPAEKGFESNALALQIHGGYGYSSEFLPESWLRDQKLNTIHEGTTGIQGLDLLGRKVMAGGGSALRALGEDISADIARAREAGVDAAWCDALAAALERVGALTMQLGGRGMSGDVAGMLLHSADYLELFSVLIVAWQWLAIAAAAKTGLHARPGDGFYEGKLCAAQYWFATELPRVAQLADLCASGDDAYGRMDPSWF